MDSVLEKEKLLAPAWLSVNVPVPYFQPSILAVDTGSFVISDQRVQEKDCSSGVFCSKESYLIHVCQVF